MADSTLPSIPIALHELACAYSIKIHLGMPSKDMAFRSTLQVGPDHHGIHMPSRTIYLDPATIMDTPCHWLHEVAHVVCSPPWEKTLRDSNEMALIFGWERACGRWFMQRKLLRPRDYEQLIEEQQAYLVGFDWCEFREFTREQQQVLLNHTYEVGRAAGLLKGQLARPTLKPGRWTKEVEKMWGAWVEHPIFADLFAKARR